MFSAPLTSFPQKQRGAVLAVSLILLVSITVFSIVGMNSSILNEQLSSHAQDLNQEFQAAEGAIAHIMNKNNDHNVEWLNKALLQKNVDAQTKKANGFTEIKKDTDILVQAKITANRVNMNGISLGEDIPVSFVRLEVQSQASFGNSTNPTGITHGYIRLVPN